ncbi:hypothetical protein AGMMS50293_08210 [Spirochaetia bacterium]|nr:hypothetical protein AGMMS50293_08210 [Spirochaetia bacterium]
MIQGIQNKEGFVTDGITKDKKNIKISGNVNYHIIIISDQNIKNVTFEKIISETYKLKNVKVYTLTKKQHPNQYNMTVENIMGKMDICDDAFNKLLMDIA